MAKVVIVGAGVMGTATAYPLSDNGHSVHLVGTHLDGDIIRSCKEKRFHPRLKRQIPDGVFPYYLEEISTALNGADIILGGVNSLGVHWIARTIGRYLQPGQMLIAVTKGLETTPGGDLIILPDVVAGELPEAIRSRITYAAIGGPCIAGELAGRRQSCVVFGSREAATVETLAAVFRTPYYHIWTTTDLVGLEYSAALKNAYALGVGVAYGLLEKAGGVDEAGANAHNMAAAIFAQSCFEISCVLKAVGANQAFASSLPGPGDLFVTSTGGRTVSFGKLLGAGHSYEHARQIMAGETLESIEIVRSMQRAIPKMEQDGLLGPGELPLMRALVDIVVRGLPVNIPFDRFFGSSQI
jgi:glycerol-3-phosphate dehydrogenase (NAD(P)+)